MKNMASLAQFDTPAAIVYNQRVRRNIQNMVSLLNAYGIASRPHCKVHKSAYFAKLQIEMGAKGITCAKISEAEAMADAGINDLFIANEIIGAQKCQRLMALSKRARVISAVDSMQGARGLDQAAKNAGIIAEVCVDINTGADRCGVLPGDAVGFIAQLLPLTHIRVAGLMGYGGNVYGKQPGKETLQASRGECEKLQYVRKRVWDELGYEINLLSAGSSYSSRYPQAINGLSESRAGNYIFNDRTTLAGGFCAEEDCALVVLSTVISVPAPDRAILDAGTKALSSDACHYADGYGYIVGHPAAKIYALNEEHAYVRVDPAAPLHIGEKVCIIPNHACVIPNLFGELILIGQEGEASVIEVEARGKLQ